MGYKAVGVAGINGRVNAILNAAINAKLFDFESEFFFPAFPFHQDILQKVELAVTFDFPELSRFRYQSFHTMQPEYANPCQKIATGLLLSPIWK